MQRKNNLQGTYIVYTQITQQGSQKRGNSTTDDLYQSKGVSENGDILNLEFYGNNDRKIKTGTYLELAYDDDRGVVAWSEIDEDEIPSSLKNILWNSKE